MRFRTIAIISGVLSVGFGLAMLVIPATIGSFYGVGLTDREALIVRLLGAAYFGYGVLASFALGITDRAARRAIACTQAVSWALGLPIVLSGVLVGLTAGTGWTIVAMEVLMPLAWLAAFFEDPPAR